MFDLSEVRGKPTEDGKHKLDHDPPDRVEPKQLSCKGSSLARPADRLETVGPDSVE